MRIELERALPRAAPAQTSSPSDSGADFDGILAEGLQKMDEVTRTADQDAEAMVQGEMDLHEAMISMEKANLTLKLGTTVRNKLLDAYRQLTQAAS